MSVENKFVFFRTDRMGDFIMNTKAIYELKNKFLFSKIIIVCSPLNKKLIESYSFVDQIILYDKKYPFFKKFIIFLKIIKNKYHSSFVLDGKSFSYFCNIFLRSNYKSGIIYKKAKKFLRYKINFFRSSMLYNYLFFNHTVCFTSKSSQTKIENLCSIYLDLFRKFNLNLTIKDPYVFERKKNYDDFFKYLKPFKELNNFLLFHFDEKFNDILNIDFFLYNELNKFQKKINKKIIITSYNNNHIYYQKFKKNFIKVHRNFYKSLNNDNIYILENSDIFQFELLISKSLYAISCHSGFLVQVAGTNKSNVIDIINEKDYIWYSCWKPANTQHKFIFKSINKTKRNLSEILNDVYDYLNS